MNVQSDSIASLTPQEVETIDFYTSSTPEMRLARRERFIKETNVIEVTHVIRSTVIVAASTIAGAAAGVVIGGGLGAAVGCGIGYAVPVIGVPKGARTGLKIGAGIGGCVGGVIGGHKGKKVAERSITLRITNAEGYKNWKARAIKERVYPLFKKKILDEPAMQDLYCSISGELPQIPVKTPCNTIYQK